MTATLRRLVWIIGCFFLFLGMRIVSAWALQRIESLTKIMHLGMMMAFCGGAAAELQNAGRRQDAAKAVKRFLRRTLRRGENCSGCTCNAGNENGTGDENGVCRDAADEGCSHNDTDDESSSSGKADHEDSTRKLLRPGRTIVRPNSYYAVLCCKTERVPSGTLLRLKFVLSE